jgi:hypothetical protein
MLRGSAEAGGCCVNKRNRLDPILHLDAVARSGGGESPQAYLFLVATRERAEYVLSDLLELGWRVSLSRREAMLNSAVIRVVVAGGPEGARGLRSRRIAGYAVSPELAFDARLRRCIEPCLLGNPPAEAAANE